MKNIVIWCLVLGFSVLTSGCANQRISRAPQELVGEALTTIFGASRH